MISKPGTTNFAILKRLEVVDPFSSGIYSRLELCYYKIHLDTDRRSFKIHRLLRKLFSKDTRQIKWVRVRCRFDHVKSTEEENTLLIAMDQEFRWIRFPSGEDLFSVNLKNRKWIHFSTCIFEEVLAILWKDRNLSFIDLSAHAISKQINQLEQETPLDYKCLELYEFSATSFAKESFQFDDLNEKLDLNLLFYPFPGNSFIPMKMDIFQWEAREFDLNPPLRTVFFRVNLSLLQNRLVPLWKFCCRKLRYSEGQKDTKWAKLSNLPTALKRFYFHSEF